MELGSVNYEDFTSSAQSEMDKRLLVKFFIKPLQDKTASIAAGRPIFRDREYIKIGVPGTKDSVARPAREQDKYRFSRHYEAFKKRIEIPLQGTPLTEWPVLPRSAVEEMAFLQIKTVEQLAHVADSAGDRYGGLLNWKRRAQEWLELAETDAPLQKLAAEVEAKEITLAAQQATIDALTQRLDDLEAKQAQVAAPPPESTPTSLQDELIAAIAESVPPPEHEPPPVPETIKRRRGRPRKNPIKE